MLRQIILLCAGLSALIQGSPIPDEESIGGRILGGEDTHITELPFMASLRNLNNNHFCGASILNRRWVLSAAHCTIFRGHTSINVVAGTSFRTHTEFVHRSSMVVNHPEYNNQNLRNDISLVQTAEAFNFNVENVNPINLPTESKYSGFGHTAGWGNVAPGGPLAYKLQRLDVEILSHQGCIGKIGNNPWMDDNKVCVYTRIGQGNCNGDSGGPLIVEGTVVGIVSWGFIPCGSHLPDVLERVYPHNNWITSTIS